MLLVHTFDSESRDKKEVDGDIFLTALETGFQIKFLVLKCLVVANSSFFIEPGL